MSGEKENKGKTPNIHSMVDERELEAIAEMTPGKIWVLGKQFSNNLPPENTESSDSVTPSIPARGFNYSQHGLKSGAEGKREHVNPQIQRFEPWGKLGG